MRDTAALIAILVSLSACQVPGGKPSIEQSAPVAARERIIVSYDGATPDTKRRILEAARAGRHSVVYELTRMNIVVVGDIPAASLDVVIKRFSGLPGVLSVERDGTLRTQKVGE